jgi:hypothetical protein
MALAAPAFAEARYFSAIEDLPMPPELQETAAEYVFVGEGGRIIEAAAVGTASAERIRAFYQQCLPALGWSQSPGAGGEGELIFLRGRERLSVLIAETGGSVRLGVRLYVRSPPGD